MGVDLLSGKVIADMGSLSIGEIGAPALSYSVLATSGYADATVTDGIKHRDCANYAGGGIPGCVYQGYSYSLNGSSDYYMMSPPSTTAPAGFTEQRAMVVAGGLIRRDGSVWEFGNGGLTIQPGNPYAIEGLLTKITRPDGEVLTYNYVQGELRSIVSSTGYMIHLQGNKGPYYHAPGFSILQPGQPDKVTMINLAVDYCDPLATSCSGLMT